MGRIFRAIPALAAALLFALAPISASAQLMLLGVGPVRTSIAVTGTFSPTDKEAGLAITGGNLTMGIPGGGSSGWAGVRSTTSHATGKWCEEWDDTAQGGNWTVGIADATLVLSNGNYIGSSPKSWGWYDGTNTVFNNGGGVPAITATWPSVGTKKIACFDLDNSKGWYKDNAGLWNGGAIGAQNPATATGGFPITPSTTYFAAAGANINGPTLTMNFGATTFTNTVPAGFSPWG